MNRITWKRKSTDLYVWQIPGSEVHFLYCVPLPDLYGSAWNIFLCLLTKREVSIRGIPRGRGWAHLACSGIQSEHKIHLILPARAVSYMIKWLIEQDIYWPIISYPISRSQVSTCGFFPRKRQIELLSYSIQHMMVSWWSNEPFFFFPLAP